MPNAIKWEAAVTSRGNVLAAELNNVVDGARSAAGTEIDNSTNLDKFGWFEMNVTPGSAPAAGGHVRIYMIGAPDGTNYGDGDASNDPGMDTWLINLAVRAEAEAQRKISKRFELPPMKVKFIAQNEMGVAFPASGSTLELFTANDEVQ